MDRPVGLARLHAAHVLAREAVRARAPAQRVSRRTCRPRPAAPVSGGTVLHDQVHDVHEVRAAPVAGEAALSLEALRLRQAAGAPSAGRPRRRCPRGAGGSPWPRRTARCRRAAACRRLRRTISAAAEAARERGGQAEDGERSPGASMESRILKEDSARGCAVQRLARSRHDTLACRATGPSASARRATGRAAAGPACVCRPCGVSATSGSTPRGQEVHRRTRCRQAGAAPATSV